MVIYLHLCCVLSRFIYIRLFVTIWTIACQDLLSFGFSRQEYWNGDLPDSGLKPTSVLQADSLLLSP